MKSQHNNKTATISIFELPVEVLVSLATSPALALLIASKAISGLLEGFSKRSEELFRGERLPSVRFPHTPE